MGKGSSGKGKSETGRREERGGSDEEFEEVLCERECNAGFKVLLGRTLAVLVCMKCHQEYEMSQAGSEDPGLR